VTWVKDGPADAAAAAGSSSSAAAAAAEPRAAAPAHSRKPLVALVHFFFQAHWSRGQQSMSPAG
jgi:hypothetical protein